ncbi:autotransporter domain-containing protein [Rickettsia endosymbiont of Halotydeus destructor]|uniref:autotransporter domain-containing protein n=1 Tax=Rickettsia endosymbiont of Halotydeus destructor TaxID=2996754 RepID=UPI003BB05B53
MRAKIAGEGKRKREAENGNNIGASNGNNTDNYHDKILINSLKQEKLELLHRINLLEAQLNNSENDISNDNNSSKQIELIKQLKEKISLLETSNGTMDTATIINNNESAINNGNDSLEQENLTQQQTDEELSLLKTSNGRMDKATITNNNESAINNDNNSSKQIELIKQLKEKISLLETSNGTMDKATIINNNENAIDNGNDSLEQENLTQQQTKEELSLLETSPEKEYYNEELTNTNNKRSADEVTEPLGKTESSNPTKTFILEQKKQDAIVNTLLTETAHDIIEEFTKTVEMMTEISKTATVTAVGAIKNRMFEVSTLAAIGAGDEDEPIKKGAWISGLYGVNKQGALTNAPGYKGRSAGVTIGFDVGVNDDLIGIAYSNIQSHFKSNKSFGKANVTSHVLSVYGQKDLDHNFSLQGVISGARNYLKNKTTYAGSPVSGKYKSDSVSAEALLNYKYQTNYNLALIPNIGVRYGHAKDGVYNESNIGVQHLSVASEAQNLWTGILGGKVVFTAQKISDSISITPAIHGSVENYFNNKQKKVNAKVTWKNRVIEDAITLPKQPKIGYNIGGSVLAQKANISLLLEYNCHLQKKYQSHQGFAKLKINF